MRPRKSSSDYDFIYERVGERIRYYRTKKKVRQEDLAEAVGLTRASVTNLEVGNQRTPLHTLYEICEFLGINILDLIDEKDTEYQRVKEGALSKLTLEEKAALGLP